MNRAIIKLCVLVLILLVFSSSALATGPATIYKVRISRFEIFNGTSWVTLFQGESTTMDIASMNAGSSAGNFFSGLSVPDGVYTQVRVTPSPTFSFSGNDGVRYTTAGVGGFGGSTPGTAAQQAECTITLTGAFIPAAQTQDFSATPITVKDGVANRTVRVSFDVSNAVQYFAGPNEVYPAAPAVTMTVQ